MTITREELYDWIDAKFRKDTACGKAAKLGSLEAVDKIYPELKRLKKENKEMREALENIRDKGLYDEGCESYDLYVLARNILTKYPRPKDAE